jgi:hypothetical protein
VMNTCRMKNSKVKISLSWKTLSVKTES